MVSPRMRKVDETVREALADVLERDVSDPRLALVTVTSVQVSPDLRTARVYVIAHGDEERYREALAGLEAAKKRLRAGLAKRVSMKYLPDLTFAIDTSVDEGIRIAEAIREERAAGRAPDAETEMQP
jgi:ribosome-binding factor A